MSPPTNTTSAHKPSAVALKGHILAVACTNGALELHTAAGRTVCGGVQAKGVYTQLEMSICMPDEEWIFCGAARGSMDLLAVQTGRLQRALEEGVPKGAALNDYLNVHTQVEGQLRGLAACIRISEDSKTPQYLLATGRGIKNVHIWRVVIADDTPHFTKIMDLATNGTSVRFGEFVQLHNHWHFCSKSDDAKLQVWKLPISALVNCPHAMLQQPAYFEASPAVSIPHTETSLGLAGILSIGGQVSIVSLEHPHHYTEVALNNDSSSGRRRRGGTWSTVSAMAGVEHHAALVLNDQAVVHYRAQEWPALKTILGPSEEKRVISLEKKGDVVVLCVAERSSGKISTQVIAGDENIDIQPEPKPTKKKSTATFKQEKKMRLKIRTKKAEKKPAVSKKLAASVSDVAVEPCSKRSKSEPSYHKAAPIVSDNDSKKGPEVLPTPRARTKPPTKEPEPTPDSKKINKTPDGASPQAKPAKIDEATSDKTEESLLEVSKSLLQLKRGRCESEPRGQAKRARTSKESSLNVNITTPAVATVNPQKDTIAKVTPDPTTPVMRRPVAAKAKAVSAVKGRQLAKLPAFVKSPKQSIRGNELVQECRERMAHVKNQLQSLPNYPKRSNDLVTRMEFLQDKHKASQVYLLKRAFNLALKMLQSIEANPTRMQLNECRAYLSENLQDMIVMQASVLGRVQK